MKSIIPFLFLALGVAVADNVQHVVWDKTPIAITLPVGQERMITFPGQVKLGYDVSQLPADSLSVINNNDTLYLTAHSTFQPQPVQVLLTVEGKIILLNIAAQTEASDVPVEILLSKTTSQATSADSPAPEVSYVGLTRFAVQQLYTPTRLLTHPESIQRVAMRTEKQVPLLLDGSIMANPLISWQAGSIYLTAVEIHNGLKTSQSIDPRNFCGQFLTATLFPRTDLTPQLTAKDNTTAFLISAIPFSAAISECLGAGDAT